jgi:hypothetical protein
MFLFFTLLIFISVFIISSYILEKIFTAKYVNSLLLPTAVPDSNLPAQLSLAVLSKGRIFRNVSLPIPNRDGEEIQIGTAVVTKSGIFILCQICGGGILENPSTAKWKKIEKGKFTEFDNPFHLQKDARTLIDYYAEANGLSGVKSHTTVIYTNENLRFTHQKPRGVLYTRDFIKRLAYLEKNGKLSAIQVKSACQMLKNAENY